MFLARFSALCFLIIQSAAVPPEECFANFRWDDCGKPPEPVIYYWKPGSRCEVGTWRGCVPNPNMFTNEYECVETCVFNAKRNEIRQENLDNITKPADSVESMENDNEKENLSSNETETTLLIDSGFSRTTVANDALASNKSKVLNDTKLVANEAEGSDVTLASKSKLVPDEMSPSNATIVPDEKSSFNDTISDDTVPSNETLMVSDKLASNVDGETLASNGSLVHDEGTTSNENLVANETISSNNTLIADDTPASNDLLVHNGTVGFNKTDVPEDEVNEKETVDNTPEEKVDNNPKEADKPEGRSRLARFLKET